MDWETFLAQHELEREREMYNNGYGSRSTPLILPDPAVVTDRDRLSDIAKTLVKALESGQTLEDVLAKNPKVRRWYKTHKTQTAAEERKAKAEADRLQKIADKKAKDEADRIAAAAKLTPEELAIFGLGPDGLKAVKPKVTKKTREQIQIEKLRKLNTWGSSNAW